MKQVLLEWRDIAPSDIAADVTGGKKTMSVGIEKAAHMWNVTTLYIDSRYTKDGLIRGSQELVIPDDPYTVFGDMKAAEAQRLYAAHDYEGAQRIFADLAERVPEPEKSRYGTYAALTRGYAAWDVFNWGGAKDALADVLNHLNTSDKLRAERPRLEAQRAMVHQLAADNADLLGKKTLITVLEDIDRVLPLLGTLYANAQRRAAQGRYDVAAMFLYRCLELMSQHRLATWGVNTEQPDYRPLRRRIRDVDARYENLEISFFGNSRGVPRQNITLFNGYMVLSALADPLVQDYGITCIKNRITARNTSMLAHGFRLITEKEYTQFHEVVQEVLHNFFHACTRDQGAWEHDCTFVPLFQQESNV